MTFTPTTEDFLGITSDLLEQQAALDAAMNAEYDLGLLHALGSTPTPLPYAEQTIPYREGYRDGRLEWLEMCL